MGIFERLRVTKFQELPFRTRVITGAVALGLVLVLLLVLLPGGGPGEKGDLLVEEPVSAAQGGSVTSPDGRIALEIPPGALAEDTTVSIRVLSEEEWTDDIKDLSPVGLVYSLEPDGLTFQEPVTLKLALDSSLYSVGPDGIEVTVPLLYTTDTNGQPEPLQDTETVVSTEGAYIQGNITHFSYTYETKGTVVLFMTPPAIDLPPQSFFTAIFEADNLPAEELDEGQEPVNLTYASMRPLSVSVVSDDDSVVQFVLPSGEVHDETFYYYCDEGTGSYGAVLIYTMSPVDRPEFKIDSSIHLWGKAACTEEAPPPPTTTTTTPPPTTTTTTPPPTTTTTTPPPTTTTTTPPPTTTTTTPPPTTTTTTPPACSEGAIAVDNECVPCGEGAIVVDNECIPCGEGFVSVGNECVPYPEIVITPNTGVVAGDEVKIRITGLTPDGAFTKTVCVNGDCNFYNLTADGDGNFEATLIPYTAGTMTVTVVNETTGAEATVSVEVAEAPPASGSGTAVAEVADNPGNHSVLIHGEFLLVWSIVDSIITFSGFPGVSELIGTLGADGTFIATGGGTYAGFLTTFILDGYITPEGFFGLLMIGNEGGLPGALAIIYFMAFFFM